MRGKAEAITAFAISFGVAVLLQAASGAYQSSFGGYPDEPAHLITALMVRDFLASLDYRHPWDFAVQYYLHYPKVAIGHWPPVLYATAGIWFLVFGVSRAASLLFIAAVAGATGGLIYCVGKRLMARWAGGLAALLFLASPLVQESSSRFMTEHPVTLAMMASTLCFARFARTGRVGDGLSFGVVAALAILTRGSGWALALVPGLAIALTRKWHLLRQPGLWLAALPVLATCVPWYVLTRGMVPGDWEGFDGGTPFWLAAFVGFSRSLYHGLGLAVLLLAAVGLYAKIIRPLRGGLEVVPEWAALTALAVSVLALQCALPVGIEPRYMVTLVPSIVLFTAAGVGEISDRLRIILPHAIAPFGLALATVLFFAMQSFAVPTNLRNSGYEALAADVAEQVAHVPQVWLISSGAIGEGSLIVAIALQEKRPSTVALRGSNVLVTQDWLWRNSQDHFDTPEKLAAILDEFWVTIVVVDERIPLDQRRPYQDRLSALVASNDAKWEPIGSYTLVQGQKVFPNAVHVYARRPVAALSRASPVKRLEQIRALIRRDWLQ